MVGQAGFGPARELARIHEMLLQAQTGSGVLLPDTAALLTTASRPALKDQLEPTAPPLTWGLGIATDERFLRMGLPVAGPCWGHFGHRSSLVLVDLQLRCVLVTILNGILPPVPGIHRFRRIVELVYEEFGVLESRK